MLYEDISFTKRADRPFFYTDFVATLDGKVYINKKGYWPIGSKNDYDVFTILRAKADVIIDGKQTALRFGKNTIQTIHDRKFQELRKKMGKANIPDYVVVTQHPSQELTDVLQNPYGFEPIIFSEDISQLSTFLKKKGAEHVFIDGGPLLLGSFFAQNLIDEVFLTIAPKIVGNEKDMTVTLVEGLLFPPEKIKKLLLLSSQTVGDEVFLRYKVDN